MEWESGISPDTFRKCDRPVAQAATDRSKRTEKFTGTRPNPSLTARICRYGHHNMWHASLALAELPS